MCPAGFDRGVAQVKAKRRDEGCLVPAGIRHLTHIAGERLEIIAVFHGRQKRPPRL